MTRTHTTAATSRESSTTSTTSSSSASPQSGSPPSSRTIPKTRDYHGYGATDLYAVEPRLGTLATYRHLADELHRRHMKLVFDDVPNHVGQANPWVADPPNAGLVSRHRRPSQREQVRFRPCHRPARRQPTASLDALDGWFVNTLPDMNQQNPAVAQYLTQNMIWWIEEAGIDGLRIDTFPYVQRDFWQQYLADLITLYPHLTSIGEVSGSATPPSTPTSRAAARSPAPTPTSPRPSTTRSTTRCWMSCVKRANPCRSLRKPCARTGSTPTLKLSFHSSPTTIRCVSSRSPEPRPRCSASGLACS